LGTRREINSSENLSIGGDEERKKASGNWGVIWDELKKGGEEKKTCLEFCSRNKPQNEEMEGQKPGGEVTIYAEPSR